MKRVPQRTCMGCHQKKDKQDLIRIVKNKDGEVILDKEGKEQGRGAYLCHDISCFEKAMKNRRIERVFEMKLSDEIQESLRGVIFDQK